mmetsp:Transcript_60363/g.171588  ORF Transcript_60363/g.171588 Transcript_60363/m.171588 type:complete len:446 (+) Transcript_60363:78-1415(+)
MAHGHGHSGHSHSEPLLDEERGHEHGGHDSGHSHGQEKRCDGHGGGHESHGHSHGHGHDHAAERPTDDKRKMKLAIYCALFFMTVEIVGGIFANSLAIITDAAHMLSDVGGFIVSLLALQLSEMEATQEYSYGFKQAEVLGALLSVMLVWALTAILMYEAVFRFISPEEIEAPTMLVIAVIGFLVNLVLMKVLGHGHAHGDEGCSHGHGHGGEESGAAVQAAIAHVIGDIVQSLGVCLAALCIWVKPFDLGTTDSGVSKWNYADPCCTVLFGILVLFTTKSTLVRTVSTLMGKAPKHVDQAELVRRLTKIPKVDSVHDLHVWLVGSNEVLCTAHVMVEGASNATSVLNGAIEVAQGMGIYHSTFQIELVGEFDPATESYGALHRNPSRHAVEDAPQCCGGHGDTGHDQGDHHGHGGEGHGHGANAGGHGHGTNEGGHSHAGGHSH